MLADDPLIQQKMLAKHVTAVLALALEYKGLPQIQALALGFLHKLVGTREGLAEAGEDGIVPRAVHLFLSHGAHVPEWPLGTARPASGSGRSAVSDQAAEPGRAVAQARAPGCRPDQETPSGPEQAMAGALPGLDIKGAALRLLDALAADGLLRHIMVMEALLPGLCASMEEPAYLPGCVLLLQQLAQDDTLLPELAGTGLVGKVVELLRRSEGPGAVEGLMYVLAPLLCCPETLEELFQAGFLGIVLTHAMERNDERAMYLARLAVEQCPPRSLSVFREYLSTLVSLATGEAVKESVKIEALTALVALDLPDDSWPSLLRTSGLLSILGNALRGEGETEEVGLLALQCVGTLASCGCAALLTEADLPKAVLACMAAHREDDDFVMAGTLTLHELLLQEPSRSTILLKTQGLHYLADLLLDEDPEVAAAANAALDHVLAGGGPAGETVRALKFESYNAAWLRAVDAEECAVPVVAVGSGIVAYGDF
eukprot:jgi/Botrbrau1/8935/Bobra.0148s0048.1